MEKYIIEIKFKSGQISGHRASAIHFHPDTGGIDLYSLNIDTPFFPGREEEIEEIKIRIHPDFRWRKNETKKDYSDKD